MNVNPRNGHEKGNFDPIIRKLSQNDERVTYMHIWRFQVKRKIID